MSKTIKARDFRDPKALPDELRRIADRYPFHPEARDIVVHAADELEALQAAAREHP